MAGDHVAQDPPAGEATGGSPPPTAEALRLTEERLRLVLEGTGTGTWEWEVGSDTIKWSANLGPLYGLAVGDMPETFEQYLELEHPDDRPGLTAAVERAVADGLPYEREYRALWPDGTQRWLHNRCHVVLDDTGAARRIIGLVADIHERKRRELAARYLADASLCLSRNLDVEATLQEVARLAVPTLADWCVVHLADDQGRPARLAVVHEDPDHLRLAEELQERYPPDPDAPTGVPVVLRTGRSELYPDIADELLAGVAADADHLRLLRLLQPRSAMIVAMVSRGATVGAISFVFAASGRRYDTTDLELAEELGRRAGVAVDNARAHRATQRALERLEGANARLRALQTLTDVGLEHLDLPDLLDELLARITELTRGDAAAVLLTEDDGRHLVVRAAHGRAAGERVGERIPVGRGVAGRIVTSGRPVVIEDLSEVEVYSPHLRDSARSLVAAPLRAGGAVIGVLNVSTARPAGFTPDDVQLLELVADRAGRAIGHARLYERARDAAVTLQRSLLPSELPARDGVGIAARYLPGLDGSEVGGDWYDVFTLVDGRLALVVGDVVGKGLRAAAQMGQLRNAIRAYAVQASGPQEVLERIDGMVAALGGITFATAQVLFLDPADGAAHLASAGHPPPLLAGANGARLLEVRQTPPLGLGTPARAESTFRLAPEATVVLYTDGLVEERGADLDERLAALCDVAAEPPADPRALLDRLTGRMLEGGHRDDVALLAVRRDG